MKKNSSIIKNYLDKYIHKISKTLSRILRNNVEVEYSNIEGIGKVYDNVPTVNAMFLSITSNEFVGVGENVQENSQLQRHTIWSAIPQNIVQTIINCTLGGESGEETTVSVAKKNFTYIEQEIIRKTVTKTIKSVWRNLEIFDFYIYPDSHSIDTTNKFGLIYEVPMKLNILGATCGTFYVYIPQDLLNAVNEEQNERYIDRIAYDDVHPIDRILNLAEETARRKLATSVTNLGRKTWVYNNKTSTWQLINNAERSETQESVLEDMRKKRRIPTYIVNRARRFSRQNAKSSRKNNEFNKPIIADEQNVQNAAMPYSGSNGASPNLDAIFNLNRTLNYTVTRPPDFAQTTPHFANAPVQVTATDARLEGDTAWHFTNTSAQVTVLSVLTTTPISASYISNLKVGDVIKTQHGLNAQIPVKIAGCNQVFYGELENAFKENRTVRITETTNERGKSNE
jgi:flagellar motor switch protein FliM